MQKAIGLRLRQTARRMRYHYSSFMTTMCTYIVHFVTKHAAPRHEMKVCSAQRQRHTARNR